MWKPSLLVTMVLVGGGEGSWRRGGEVYFCGVTMVLCKKRKGRNEPLPLPPLMSPLPSPYVQQYGIPAFANGYSS